MKNAFSILLAVLLILPCVSLAQVWTGSTQAKDTEPVMATADGTLETFNIRVGQKVTADTLAGKTKVTSIYSPIDGTVNKVRVYEGEEISNETVISLAPVSKYLLYCTVDGAYQRVENTIVHVGDRVWLMCSMDGSHRATGRVIYVSGDNYNVEVDGGSLFTGEVVFVYREGSFNEEDHIGRGTVTQNNNLRFIARCDDCKSSTPGVGNSVIVMKQSGMGGDGSSSSYGLGTVSSVSSNSFEVTDITMWSGSLSVGDKLSFYSYSESYGTDVSSLTTAISSGSLTSYGSGSYLRTNKNDITATGTILKLNVKDGDPVERGQLLCTYASSAHPEFYCESEGWVTEVSAAEGDTVTEDQIVAKIATSVEISIKTDSSDKESLHIGTEYDYWTADEPHVLHKCRITDVLVDTASDTLTAKFELLDADKLLPIGLTVTVTDEE